MKTTTKTAWLLGGAIGLAMAGAVTAHADTAEDNFVEVLHENGITNSAGDAAMVQTGYAICADFNRGASFAGEVGDLIRASGMKAASVGTLIGASTYEFCPQFNHIEDAGVGTLNHAA